MTAEQTILQQVITKKKQTNSTVARGLEARLIKLLPYVREAVV